MIHQPTNIYAEARVPESTTVGAFCDIGSSLGEHSKVQSHVTIPPGWTFGNSVFVGPGARFANDNKPNLSKTFSVTFGTVEDDVVVGMGALIGAGVTLGKGCTIGMGAVVTKDVDPGDTVVGNPARSIYEN